MKLEPVPIFPDGGEKTNGSRDQPKYGNPESEHEPKGKPGRPSHTQPINQVPPVKKKTTAKQDKQEHPKHDTDWDHSKSKANWNKKPEQYVVDQLYKRNWKWPRHPNRTNLTRHKGILMDMILTV